MHGGRGGRCGGRPASYWDHGAPTPRPTAKRPLNGRSSVVSWLRRCTPVLQASRGAVRGHVPAGRRHGRVRSCPAPSRPTAPRAPLCGGASHEAKGRRGARGGGAGRVRAPAGKVSYRIGRWRILSGGIVRASYDSCNNAAISGPGFRVSLTIGLSGAIRDHRVHARVVRYESAVVPRLDPSRVSWKLGFWRNQLAEQLDHSTSSRDLLPFVSQERRELLVAVDLAEVNLSEGDEPIQQRQRGRLGAEGGLGLGSATEFPIEIL